MMIYVYLIVAVVVAFAVWYVMSAPKFNISLTTGGNTFEDSYVKIVFPFGTPENLRSLKQIPFVLENRTTAPLKIDWDASVFIDPVGSSNRVIHAGVKLIDRNSGQSPSVVGSRSRFNDLLIPSDNIYWREGTDKTAGGWEERPLLLAWSKSETISFRVLLSIVIGAETKAYEFDFQASKAGEVKADDQEEGNEVPPPSENVADGAGSADVPDISNASPVASAAVGTGSTPSTVAQPSAPSSPVVPAAVSGAGSSFVVSRKILVSGLVGLIVISALGYWGLSQKKAADEQTALVAKLQAEELQRKAAEEQQLRLREAEERGRREAEARVKAEMEEKLAAAKSEQQMQPVPPQQIHPALSAPSRDMLARASSCDKPTVCFNIMLEAAYPRQVEVIMVSATRLAEFNRAERGDRKQARALNAQGLDEFKNNNIPNAITLLKKASETDPGDVEIMGNLGYVYMKANQPREAAPVLSRALMLDTKRTSTWVPIAEHNAVTGNKDGAVRALLLAYEFSGNKEKTVTVYADKAQTAENEAFRSAYAAALQRIPAQGN